MNNYTVNIIIPEVRPYIYLKNNQLYSQFKAGYDAINMLPSFKKKFIGTDYILGVKNKSGHYSGIIGSLERDDVDLIFYPLPIDMVDPPGIFTPVFWESSTYIISLASLPFNKNQDISFSFVSSNLVVTARKDLINTIDDLYKKKEYLPFFIKDHFILNYFISPFSNKKLKSIFERISSCKECIQTIEQHILSSVLYKNISFEKKVFLHDRSNIYLFKNVYCTGNSEKINSLGNLHISLPISKNYFALLVSKKIDLKLKLLIDKRMTHLRENNLSGKLISSLDKVSILDIKDSSKSFKKCFNEKSFEYSDKEYRNIKLTNIFIPELRPYFYVKNNRIVSQYQVAYEVLGLVSAFKPKYIPTNYVLGVKNKTGHYNGMIGSLERDDVDMVFYPLPIEISDPPGIFTPVFYETSSYILTLTSFPSKKYLDISSSLLNFDFTIILSFIFSFIILSLFTAKVLKLFKNVFDALFTFFRLSFKQDSCFNQNNNFRAFLLLIIFYHFIIITLFENSVNSNLVVKARSDLINTVDDLFKKKSLFPFFLKDHFAMNYFINPNSNKKMKNIFYRASICDDCIQTINIHATQVLLYKNITFHNKAFIFDRSFLNVMRNLYCTGNHEKINSLGSFYTSSPIIKNYFAFLMNKKINLKMKMIIDKRTLLIHETGILHRLFSFLDKLSFLDFKDSSQSFKKCINENINYIDNEYVRPYLYVKNYDFLSPYKVAREAINLLPPFKRKFYGVDYVLGMKNKTGHYNGMIGSLERDDVDLVFYPLPIDLSDPPGIFTPVFWESSTYIISLASLPSNKHLDISSSLLNFDFTIIFCHFILNYFVSSYNNEKIKKIFQRVSKCDDCIQKIEEHVTQVSLYRKFNFEKKAFIFDRSFMNIFKNLYCSSNHEKINFLGNFHTSLPITKNYFALLMNKKLKLHIQLLFNKRVTALRENNLSERLFYGLDQVSFLDFRENSFSFKKCMIENNSNNLKNRYEKIKIINILNLITQMFNYTVKISIPEVRPYVYIKGNKPFSSFKQLYTVINLLPEFKKKFIGVEYDLGTKNKSGHYNGMIGSLERNDIDVIFYLLPIDMSDPPGEFTPVFWESSTYIISLANYPSDKYLDISSSLLNFDYNIIILFILFFVLLSLLTYKVLKLFSSIFDAIFTFFCLSLKQDSSRVSNCSNCIQTMDEHITQSLLYKNFSFEKKAFIFDRTVKNVLKNLYCTGNHEKINSLGYFHTSLPILKNYFAFLMSRKLDIKLKKVFNKRVTALRENNLSEQIFNSIDEISVFNLKESRNKYYSSFMVINQIVSLLPNFNNKFIATDYRLGTKNKTGHYNGIIGKLQNDEVDLIFYPLPIEMIDPPGIFSKVFFESSSYIISLDNKPSNKYQDILYSSFNFSFDLIIIILLIFIALTFFETNVNLNLVVKIKNNPIDTIEDLYERPDYLPFFIKDHYTINYFNHPKSKEKVKKIYRRASNCDVCTNTLENHISLVLFYRNITFEKKVFIIDQLFLNVFKNVVCTGNHEKINSLGSLHISLYIFKNQFGYLLSKKISLYYRKLIDKRITIVSETVTVLRNVIEIKKLIF
uniref:Ligated ion channel binding I - glutamate n=1 Tax=Polyphagotarsonemus latus TaxID=1204166 RepID=A0AAN0LJ52_9ACAR